ncbi:MAG: hypothetical protein HFG70_13390 [Hungatella sp.]|nr:hypothetical protein [Hungatella sp.]
MDRHDTSAGSVSREAGALQGKEQLMRETFLTKVDIKLVRHLRDIEIPLGEHEPRHLILTER